MPEQTQKRRLPLVETAWQLGRVWTKTRLLGQRVPLFVSWNLTFHCNLRCHYCASPSLKVPELSTEEVLHAMDQFHALGTRWITFSGGEPLLRNDIGTIVNHAKDRGIRVFISTNGALLPRRIDDVRRVDRITISLDGAAEVHNEVRGKNAWDQAVAAIELCHQEGIYVACTCVLSSQNLHTVDELLRLADELRVNIMFQPATKWLDSSDKPNALAPDTTAYRATIDRLVKRKHQGSRVANSYAGLRVLRRWPDPTPIRSTAGWVYCTVEPDGKMIASHVTAGALLEAPRNGRGEPWEHYVEMPLATHHDQPWCAPTLELDLLFGLSPSAVINALRIQL